MDLITSPPNPAPAGLTAAIEAAAHSVAATPDGWLVDDAVAVQAIIDSYAGSSAELQYWQTQRSIEVAAQRDALISAGFTYSGVLIAIDDASQNKITSMAAIASNTIAGLITTAWPASFAWLAQGNGSSLPLATPQAMIQFGGAVGHYVSALILYEESLLVQIAAATTATEVQAIDPTAGWPSS